MRTIGRLTALLGSALLATSMAVGTAATATASSTDTVTAQQRYSCRVSLDQRGDWLRVAIRSNARNETADVRANFDSGRDQRERVRLGRDGDAVTRFRVPSRADSVRVRVHIDVDRGRDITCSDSLRLRQPR